MADTPYKGSPVADWVIMAYPMHTQTHGMIDGKMQDIIAVAGVDSDTLRIAELMIARDNSNPRKLPNRIVSILVSADLCAKCLGELDTGWECIDCGYDWKQWKDASTEINNIAFDRREA